MRRGVMALWRSALGLSVLTLMLVGCSATPHGATPTHSSMQATAPVAPAKMLDWRKVSLPPGIPSTIYTANAIAPVAPVVSPVNGRDAWVCAPGSGTSFQVWRTQDAAATWRHMSTLTPTAPLPITTCSLTANQGDADAVAANFAWSSDNGPSVSSGSLSYYSADDGANWIALRRDLWIQQVITVGATTYAALLNTTGQVTSLVASADHLATWRIIQPPTQHADSNSVFWAATAPGELLWGVLNSGLLFQSSDAGGSWTAIPSPTDQTVQVSLAAWRSQPPGWLVCGYVNIGAGTPGVTAQSQCSADLGKTWIVRPNLTDTWECGHCAQGGGSISGVHPCLPTAITSDGALYAVCGNDPQDSGTPPTPWTISRLSPGAATWTTLGLALCQDMRMTQTGQAWCFDSGSRSTYILDQLP